MTFSKQMTPKLENRGHIFIFWGYSDDHAHNTFHLWDPRSCRVHTTCNVQWLHCMDFENVKSESNEINSDFLFGEGVIKNGRIEGTSDDKFVHQLEQIDNQKVN
jgi:hypothetical protein